MLISFGKLKMNQNQTKENYFSIDNYFNGLYNNQKPDTTIKWIPNYYLPKNSDYNNAMIFIDSLSFLNNTIYFDTVQVSNNYCKNDTLNHLPFSPCGMIFKKKKSPLIFNLFDNVSEVSFTYNASNDEDLSFKELLLKYPSDYVGFRNAFRWIKY